MEDLLDDISTDEIEPIGVEEDIDDGSAPILQPFDPAEIRVESKQLSLDTLLSRMSNKEIILQPDFQRQEVWKDDARSRLIESILIRIPLPAFYMDATDDERWLVVDGQQRLSTLRRFVIEQDLPLTGLEFLKDLHGDKFDDLPRQFQRRIKETNVTVYLIQQGTPGNVKINIFKRINTGGLPLSSQEIRHALNGKGVTTMLKELAESASFASATRNSIPRDRMADREYITRFLAFILTKPDNYVAQEFDSFLNEAMCRIDSMPDDQRRHLTERFLRAMRTSQHLLGRYAFRKKYKGELRLKPINKALFEAWSVNFDALTDNQVGLLAERRDRLIEGFEDLMAQRSFEQAVTQGTGDVRKVRLRFSSIRDLIGSVLA